MATRCVSDRHTMKESGLRIRVEPELRRRFVNACRRRDLTASQVVRAFMRAYLEGASETLQQGLFDDNAANEVVSEYGSTTHPNA